MASKLAEKAPGWTTRILLPEIAEMKGEIKNVDTKIDELDKCLTDKIDSNFLSLNSRIDGVNTRIAELDKRLTGKLDSNFFSLNLKIDSNFSSLGSRIDSLRNELKSDISKVESKVEDLNERLDIVQRLSVLEVKQREIDSKTR